MKHLCSVVAVCTAVVLAAGAFGSSTAWAQISGATFTTDKECIGTNVNLYSNKKQVWLDGGPRKEGAAGLPDGEYYVQVTEPDGTLLGTSLAADDPTPVLVVNGSFVECYLLWDILRRASNLNRTGYDDTSNGGGEYKVWVSKLPDFPGSESKTDNFKVRNGGGRPVEQAEIRAIKFYDLDLNGQQGDPSSEPVIPMWHIELKKTDGTLVACSLTDGGGEVRFLVDQDGTEYVVVETLVGDYINTTPLSVAIFANAAVVDVMFGNVCKITLEGMGRTPGFWQSCNNDNGAGIVGCDLLSACDPEWRTLLNGLCLVYPDGSDLVIPEAATFEEAFAVLDGWITGLGAEGNMAYILSRHVAALALNAHCGPLSEYSDVLAPCNGEVIPLEGLLESANDLLCSFPDTPGNSADAEVIDARAAQEALKNCLDAINSNQVTLFAISPVPCPFLPVPCP